MQGFSHLAIVLIAIIATVSQVRSLTPEQTCPLVKNNTFIGDTKSCEGYFFCRDGKPIPGKCNKGQYYDAATGVCDYPENVQCNINAATMCTGLTDVYKADPDDCNKYCYCHDGATYCQRCPTGQNYDPFPNACVWASTSNCVSNSPCRRVQNGFMGDGKTCNGYIRCGSNQVVKQGVCGGNLYYNPSNGMCDDPQKVNCAINPPGPVTPTAPPPPADLCKAADKFYSDGETCRGYFYCKVVGATGQWGQCPKKSLFSEALGKCVDPDLVACPHDRCDGSSKSFMAKAGTDCKQYYICKNGVGSEVGTCPAAYSIFNENAGVCQSTAYNKPICTEILNK